MKMNYKLLLTVLTGTIIISACGKKETISTTETMVPTTQKTIIITNPALENTQATEPVTTENVVETLQKNQWILK